MGCSSSNSSMGDGIQKVEPRQKSAKPKEEKTEPVNYPPSEAYVISFNNVDDNVLTDQTIVTTSTWNAATAAAAATAKTETFHPPERLQKALEEHTNANGTDSISNIETITEKLEKAELRRQAIIRQKIEKAQKSMKNFDETNHENDGNQRTKEQ